MRGWVVLLALGCKEGGQDEPDPEDPCVAEIPYDELDQDCDGSDLVDVDQDGHDAIGVGGDDCDDDDELVHPGAAEVPYDGLDQDCIAGDLVDVDGDGEPALVAGGLDCDDEDPLVLPSAVDEVGNDVDDDCDGIDGVDADQDGAASTQSGGRDCADDDPAVFPGAVETWYDGVDQDCDRGCDYDQDDDGAILPGSPVPNGGRCDTVPGPEAFAPDDCDELDPLVNDVRLNSTFPQAGEIQVNADTTVLVFLTEPDPVFAVEVLNPFGGVVPGTVVAGQESLEWTPVADLALGTTYDVQVTHSCGTETVSFTTDWAVVEVDPDTLVGQVWDVDLETGSWLEPMLVGDLFAATLAESGLLAEVVGAGPDTLDFRLGFRDLPGQQEPCLATVDVSADFSANPAFTTDPMVLPFAVDILPFTLVDATFSAGIRGDGEALVDTVLAGQVDTRPMVDPVFGPGFPPSEFCSFIQMFGSSCTECLDGTGPFCMPIEIVGARGVAVGTPITPLTQADVDADPACP